MVLAFLAARSAAGSGALRDIFVKLYRLVVAGVCYS